MFGPKGNRKHLKRLTTAASLALLAGSTLLGSGYANAVEVGVAAAVNRDAFGTPPGASRSTIVLGDNVIFRERIETSSDGLVQVLLVDGSTFTVGANSDLVIDEFVYDPDAGTGKLVVSFGKGVARFVGGKLSKQKGGVTVNTPVGTIGIRGGIANLNLEAEQPAFSLLFGEELTFSGTSGRSQRIFENGYTMQIGPNGSPGIRRTTQADLGSVQKALSSRRGQSGGASKKPTNKKVAQSGVSRANSDLGVVATTPPPKPQTVATAELDGSESKLIQSATQDQTIAVIEEEEDNEGEVETANVRVLRAGDTFAPFWDSSRVVSDPGNQGLAGGTYGLDETIVFVESVTDSDAYRLWYGDVGEDRVYVFDEGVPTFEYYAQSMTDQGHVSEYYDTSYVPVAPDLTEAGLGTLTANAQGVRVIGTNFALITHFPAVVPGVLPGYNYGGKDVIYGLYGVPTNFDDFGADDGELMVRGYHLYGDALTSFQMGDADALGNYYPLESEALFVNPLIAADLGSDFMSAVSSTGLLMIEDDTDTLEGARFLASSFLIDGNGTDQKSMVSLITSLVFDDNGELTIDTGRRGGHRRDAYESAGLYGGALLALRSADGGRFFGPDADNFVLGAALDLNDPFGDGYVHRPDDISQTDTLSATMHAGQLVGEIAVSELTRSTRTLYGFAAGVVESSANYWVTDAGPVAFASENAGDFMMTLNQSNSTVSGSIGVSDTFGKDSEVERYDLGFGTSSDGYGTSRGVYIDEDTYAARNAALNSDTAITTDNGAVIAHVTDGSPKTYMLPSSLVPGADDAIMAGKTECVCAFLEWGYWGTSANFKDDSLTADGERYDNVHLGTWVAGDVTNSADLPTTGSAAYIGHAVGNVINDGAQYLAAGSFGMTVDFAKRTGAAAIADFDGRSFGASLTEQDVVNGNLFSGSVANMEGQINTSIVRGVNSEIDGVLGNFNVQDGTWGATGIVAGELQ